MAEKNKAFVFPIIIGIVLIVIGLCITVPGGVLTTRKSLNGEETEYYILDNKYSSIDEYVGGDAYNYIIGASLVAGKISGAMTSRSIFIVGGIMCICFGFTLLMLRKKSKYTTNTVPASNYTVPTSSSESNNSFALIETTYNGEV